MADFSWRRLLFPLVLFGVAGLCLWPLRGMLTAEGISRLSPGQTGLAAGFLLALYAVKGISVVLPLSALTAAGGLLFSYPLALAVNLAGTALAQTLPWLLGRRGRGDLDALLARYPRLAALRAAGREDGWLVFLLRLAGASPGDLVSLSLGAAGVPFGRYLPPGLLGAAPRVAAGTLLGASLWDPWSGQFWVSLGLNAAVTVGSLAIWRVRRH